MGDDWIGMAWLQNKSREGKKVPGTTISWGQIFQIKDVIIRIDSL